MISPDLFNNLSNNDKIIFQTLWLCPRDNTPLDKITGPVSGEQDISRGIKKTDVAINNAVAMKKLDIKDQKHAKMVVNLSFQLIPDDYITFTFVECSLCDYHGLAPKLPIQMQSSNIRKTQIIDTLIEESKSSYKQQNRGGTGGFRRGGIFLWFILISLLPLIASVAFFLTIAIAYIFRIGLV
ncbi:MAG: hypothetical protein HeimC3_20870 [Candidatus Heimdallarchaeota archaeon LC_3]|nr:MAG: hypothetical protein HeimC3_20870 [Candidatus Heimdallarchaeota archaeon LC_3]